MICHSKGDCEICQREICKHLAVFGTEIVNVFLVCLGLRACVWERECECTCVRKCFVCRCVRKYDKYISTNQCAHNVCTCMTSRIEHVQIHWATYEFPRLKKKHHRACHTVSTSQHIWQSHIHAQYLARASLRKDLGIKVYDYPFASQAFQG